MASRTRDKEPFPWRLWSTIFVLTIIAASFIQLVLLPFVFPSWSSGEGLVDNCLDCASYHKIASEMAARIRETGWSAWELRPEGHAPAGLAAALYAITIPRLWTMIPVNAAVHATTVTLLFLILKSFGYPSRTAALGAIPFALFPSSALWYAQLMKDGFFFLGFFLFLRGWLSVMQSSGQSGRTRAQILAVVQGLAGAFLLWVIRPEMVKLILCLSFIVCVAALCVTQVSARYRPARQALLKGGVLILAASAFVVCLDYLPAHTNASQSVSARVEVSGIDQRQAPAPDLKTPPAAKESILILGRATAMLRTFGSIPARLTAAVIRKRQAYLSDPGASSMDVDWRLETFPDLIAYLPRATRNAFLSPFPSQWVGQGTYASTTSLRRLCGLEMLVVYFALGFVPFAVWRRRADVFLWAILIYSGGILVVLGTIVNNWGTLYRLRYGYLMLWVGIGLCGFLQLAAELRLRQKRGNQPG